MATSTTKNKIIKLSTAEYTTLSTTGTLTKDGVTYTYSPSDTIYVTPDNMSKQYATITDNSTVALADNTEYSGTDLTTVTFTYPSGNFECYMSLSFASSGTITVTFPTSSYIGSAPTFANGETWEISIKNSVIIAGKVESV